MTSPAASSERPLHIDADAQFRKWAEADSGATQLWSIVVDEGWREWFLCQGMYEQHADWLLTVLEDRRFDAH